VRAVNPLFGTENLRRIGPLLGLLREVADAHQARPAQIALAWLLGLPRVVVIPGASSVEQLEHNAAAAAISLTADEQAALTAAARAFTPLSGVRSAVDGVRELVGDWLSAARGGTRPPR
jgi:aryl-alcohol dehydrogenase-like predicted oxidoreductase